MTLAVSYLYLPVLFKLQLTCAYEVNFIDMKIMMMHILIYNVCMISGIVF
jgi:hypothetical protein